jgi:hypothetical protein
MPLSDRERRIIASLEQELGGERIGRPRLPAGLTRRRRALLAVVVGVLVGCGGMLLGLVGAPAYVALGILPPGLAAAIWGGFEIVTARLPRAGRHPARKASGG